MRNLLNSASLRLLFAALLVPLVGGLARGQEFQNQTNTRTRQSSVQHARATWTPSRTKQKQKPAESDAAFQHAPEPVKKVTHRKVSAPQPRKQTRRVDSQVRQAQHVVPGEIIYEGPVVDHGVVEGGVVYEGPIVNDGCDAMGSCGCDADGCDGIGNCGPNCGCSLCGEIPSGRAWRPALTLSLPQDGWVSLEAIHFWQDGMDLPPLLTTSSTGTARADAGILNRSTTSNLFGGEPIFEDALDGVRVRFGFWLDKCHTYGIGGEFFGLDREELRFSATSTGDPIIARPFFNTLTGLNDSELVAFPGVVSGTATVTAYSELTGGSFYLRSMRCCDEGCRQGLFCGCNERYCTRSEFRIGYRYMELEEGVGIREELVVPDPGSFDILDQFDTRNQFNGLDLAWNHRLVRGYWNLDGLVRIAVGNTNQTVTIAGSQSITDSTGTTETFDSGILAASTIVGTHEQDEFSIIPEVGVTLGYQLTKHLKASVGYTGIYWSNVVRPGQHIPTMLNPELIEPAITPLTADAMPQFAFDTTDYWVHGVTYGLEYRW
ncbi:MAG: BBP7 family outer membrane beta-barrel protein [Planctomycetota bacterium]